MSHEESGESQRDRFARWQGRALEQSTAFNRLLLGLTTGLLGFQAQAGLTGMCGLWRTLLFLSPSGLSLTFGLFWALNRVRSFNYTAHVARHRQLIEKNKRKKNVDEQELADLSAKLGEWTSKMRRTDQECFSKYPFYGQFVLFWAGVVAAVIQIMLGKR